MQGRLLFVAPSAYVLGGLSTWLDSMEQGLADKGWDVTVGLVEGSRFHSPARYIEVHPHKNWIPILAKTGTPEGRCRAIVKGVRRTKPDIVVSVNIPDVYPAMARMRLRGSSKARTVMAVHGIQADLFDDMSSYNDVLDAVVCTNRLACRLGNVVGRMPRERIFYAPCGVRLREPGNRPDKKTLRIAYVGRLEQDQKRVRDIPPVLEGLGRLAVPFELMVAGDGPEEAWLRRTLSNYEEAGNVRFLGRLSGHELADRVYRRSDAVLILSSWETGPIVAWEAMSFGVPVVSSRYVGHGAEAALVHERNAMLFPVGDASSAADCFASLWRDPELGDRLRTGGYELVRDRYTTDISVKAWHSAFLSVLKSTSHSVSPSVPAPSASGRLERLVGIGVSETVRNLLQRRWVADEPGGEWPHSYGRTQGNDCVFWETARRLDGLQSDKEGPQW